MEWRRFEGDGDVPPFIDAAIGLHRDCFDRLAVHERPSFLDWWLRLLNASHAWLLGDGTRPQALVTVPHRQDAHGFRWAVRTLAVAPEVWGQLVLPGDVDLSRSFMMPGAPGTPPCADLQARPVQLGYVGRLDSPDAGNASTSRWRFHRTTAEALPAILTLMARSYAPESDGVVNLDRQRIELDQILRHEVGWCVHATAIDDETPIGVASYIVIHVPLAGIPAILVGDLAVDPQYRGQGLATALQRYAFGELGAIGFRWVVGNIEPMNEPSRRQASRLGRIVWYTGLRLSKGE